MLGAKAPRSFSETGLFQNLLSLAARLQQRTEHLYLQTEQLLGLLLRPRVHYLQALWYYIKMLDEISWALSGFLEVPRHLCV